MKTTTYQTADGELFSADSARQLMEKLRASSWNPENSLDAYIEATAKASQIQTGTPHRSGSPEGLVEDLLASGLVLEVPYG